MESLGHKDVDNVNIRPFSLSNECKDVRIQDRKKLCDDVTRYSSNGLINEANFRRPDVLTLELIVGVNMFGVRKGSKAAAPVHRSFFAGAPVKFTG